MVICFSYKIIIYISLIRVKMVNIYYILIIIYLIIINIMEEEQYDIEQKQDYLRNEILEPG